MPDLTPAALYVRKAEKDEFNLNFLCRGDTTNQSSLFDLNASLNSSVYRKRRRKSLFRVNITKNFSTENTKYLFLSFPVSIILNGNFESEGESSLLFSKGIRYIHDFLSIGFLI